MFPIIWHHRMNVIDTVGYVILGTFILKLRTLDGYGVFEGPNHPTHLTYGL